MVRIAHLADTHLGYKQYNLEEREKDIYDSLEEIADKILEEHADIVIHSGDLFDSPRPTPQAYCAFKRFLKKLEGRTTSFAVLGDHDRPKSRGLAPQVLFGDQIRILGISGNAEHQVMKVDGQDVLIAGLSNLSRAYRPVLIEELKKLGGIQPEGKIGVLALHQGIDRFLPYEGASEISLDEVPRNFDYVAMGHLHARIKASFGHGELAYPGSSEIIRKDEIDGWNKLGKGFCIADVDRSHVELRDINLECIRPQIEAKLSYTLLEKELIGLIKQTENLGKLPVVHVRVEGKDIDRQGVHKALTAALAGKALAFKQYIAEEAKMRLPELKPGSFYINQVVRDYFKNENEAELALEMLKHLRHGDTDEAKKVADGFFEKVKEHDSDKGQT